MLSHALSTSGDRYPPIKLDLGFVFCVEMKIVGDGYVIRKLIITDQDFVHNHKKLINHLYHTSCQITMDPTMIHSNHSFLVQNRLPFEMHGLAVDHVIRRDRQKVLFLQVQQCMEQLIERFNMVILTTV